MYLPESFEETRIEILHEMIRAYPFGTLVTLNKDELEANHIPFELDCAPKPFGVLRAHVARSNPVWHEHSPNGTVLAIFQGPQTYISPSWYPTKMETGMVVPTWNYVVVHAHGRLRAIEDKDWIRNFLESLTGTHEGGRKWPWKISDAPAHYIEKQLDAIVGLELTITRLVGKWKVSQNRPTHDRAGVIRGLVEEGRESSLAMANLVQNASDEIDRRTPAGKHT